MGHKRNMRSHIRLIIIIIIIIMGFKEQLDGIDVSNGLWSDLL